MPRKSGFRQTGALLNEKIRQASQSRGFGETRILTHWAEIAGSELASHSRPIEISYGKKGLGARLTILTSGAFAPLLEMQKEQLRQKMNAIYGYNAISKIQITQSSGAALATPKAQQVAPATPSVKDVKSADKMTGAIESEGLRKALTMLGAQILRKENKDLDL